jgi:DNA primase
MLVSNLIMMSGADNPEARAFVMTHENLSLPDYEDVEKHDEPLQVISDSVLKRFEKVPPTLKMLAERNLKMETVKRWGLRYDRGGYRLIFPVRDPQGMLVGVRGRLTIPPMTPKTPKYLTYKGFSTTDPKAYGIWYGMHHRLAKGKKLILVEGELDAILLAQALAQRDGVWAAMGAAVSSEQIRAIQASGHPILLFFDDDEAGYAATAKIINRCKQVVPGLFRVKDYQGCKDPAELVEKGLLGEALKSIEHFA